LVEQRFTEQREGGLMPAENPARAAVIAAALPRLDSGMTVGLGSGRAVWGLIEALAARWAGSRALRVVPASSATEELARRVGFDVVELDGQLRLDLAVDGADEADRSLQLLKGHGAALLREKLVVSAAERFLVIAESHKLVDRLGQSKLLPVEVIRFAWADTRRRLLELFPKATLRVGPDGSPVVTDEGHYLLDCVLPPVDDLADLAGRIKSTVGVVEHGLFVDLADEVLLGTPQGEVSILRRTPD
jgi:ribose 5-phosphate isomerase A